MFADPTDFKPRFSLGPNVAVMRMDRKDKYLQLRVRVACQEYEMKTPPIQHKITESVKWATKYMAIENIVDVITEGGWFIDIVVVGYPPPNQAEE